MNVCLATQAMGTRFELILHGGDELFLRAAGEEAIELIGEQHDRLNAFAPGSLVSRINTLAADRPVEVDQELWSLLELCARVWRQSNGAFDPAVGVLMERWGFRSDAAPASACRPTRPPGFGAVELDARSRTVRFHERELALDFGGVAKGFALDLAGERLRQVGVECALLHGGTSTSIAIGSAPDGSPWQIRIPSFDSRVALRAGLVDKSLSVSSPAGRTAERAGERVGHVMDPILGRPVRASVAAAVAGPSAAESDAWSTALVVLGRRVASMPAGLVSAILLQGQEWSLEPDGQTVFACDAECRHGG